MNRGICIFLLLILLLVSGCKLNVAANLHPFQDPPKKKACRAPVHCEYRNSGELL